MSNLLYLDFEYRNTAERDLTLVSVAYILEGEETGSGSFWLLDPGELRLFAKFIRPFLETHTIVSYAMTAEARSLFTLFDDLRPSDLKCFDLYLNYRCLLNHCDELGYGKQLIDGEVKVTKKPKNKWERTEEDDLADGSKPSYSLAASLFKLLNVRIDSKHKDEMRDLIIHGSLGDLEKNREKICEYAESDVKYLPELLRSQYRLFCDKGIPPKEIGKFWLSMGEYACRTAWMERLGYPVNVPEIKRFTAKITEILNSAAEAVNEECPEVGAFEFNPKTGLYVKKDAPIRNWIVANCDVTKWKQTDGGKPSTSIDSWREQFDSTSPGFPGAIIRYLKTKQSLNGFSPNTSKRGSFYDYLGSDGRVRPYFGIYGSQSSRSQPSATGFLPLKAHWMRYFIDAPSGRAITGVDYASQEFLIAALLSDDEEMVAAYRTGDVYLAFGKASSLIPADGTKETHKRERDICKTLVLGISYDMGPGALARRLKNTTGKNWSDDEAKELIDLFYEVYASYREWKWEIQEEYEGGSLSLRDGWTMWGDNDNFRSVGNFPVQGAGAVIMRKAVALAQDSGLNVIYTLHDAIYVEHDSVVLPPLADKMRGAFMSYFDNASGSDAIRLDVHTWGRGLTGSERYMDEKGEKDLKRYLPFFN